MRISESELMGALRSDIHSKRKRGVIRPLTLGIDKIEVPIKIENRTCGYIDICGTYRGAPIAIEVKGGRNGNKGGGTDVFWDSTKIIAYTKIKHAAENQTYIPGVMLPHDIVSSNIMAMSIYLNIVLFTYYKDEDAGKIRILDLSSAQLDRIKRRIKPGRVRRIN